jgi:hypothetical protein
MTADPRIKEGSLIYLRADRRWVPIRAGYYIVTKIEQYSDRSVKYHFDRSPWVDLKYTDIIVGVCDNNPPLVLVSE